MNLQVTYIHHISYTWTMILKYMGKKCHVIYKIQATKAHCTYFIKVFNIGGSSVTYVMSISY